MKGGVMRHVLAAAANGTPPPKHMTANMTTDELANLPAGLSLTRIVEACEKYRVDPHEVIAIALSDEMRAQAESSGMTMKAQAELAWKLIDKAEPSKRATEAKIEHSGSIEVTERPKMTREEWMKAHGLSV